MTRFVGMVALVPLAWEYLQQLRAAGGLRAIRIRPLVACASPVIGAGLCCLYMWWKFGDPFMYFQGQLHWGRRHAWFYLLFDRASFSLQPVFYQVWFAASVLVAFLLMLWGALARIPLTYTICTLTFSYIYISSRFVEALPRYFSVLFPFYAVLALIGHRRPPLQWILIGVSLLLLAMSVTLFVSGFWFT